MTAIDVGSTKKHDRESTVGGNLKLLKSQDMSTKPTIRLFLMCSGICNHRCPFTWFIYVRPRFQEKKRNFLSKIRKGHWMALEGETRLLAKKKRFSRILDAPCWSFEGPNLNQTEVEELLIRVISAGQKGIALFFRSSEGEL